MVCRLSEVPGRTPLNLWDATILGRPPFTIKCIYERQGGGAAGVCDKERIIGYPSSFKGEKEKSGPWGVCVCVFC
jgi:hypothetical protein